MPFRPDFLGQGIELRLIGAQRRALIPHEHVALAVRHVGRLVEVQLLGINHRRLPGGIIRPSDNRKRDTGQDWY